jgi:hypothetical protein
MPQNKKGKRENVPEATAETDDTFEDMLAELRAADLIATTAKSSSSGNFGAIAGNRRSPASGRSSSIDTELTLASSFQNAVAEASDVKFSEIELAPGVRLCRDISLLRRWARRGVRVSSGLPLVHAAGFGDVEVMRFLVSDLGAGVNQAMNDCTPLYAAAQECHSDSVRCLVNELGADVNQGDRVGFTPLINAARNGRLAVVQCLVKELGADANRAEQEGGTPLYIAAQLGHVAVVQCLIQEGGANVNQPTKDGATPLMIAAIMKHKKVIAYLLKHGANTKFAVSKHGTAADKSRKLPAPPPRRPHTWRPRRTAPIQAAVMVLWAAVPICALVNA